MISIVADRPSHRAVQIIRQNITVSLGVKAVFAVLTILGHANLWTAIAADMGVSLAVVFNALRLLSVTDSFHDSNVLVSMRVVSTTT